MSAVSTRATYGNILGMLSSASDAVTKVLTSASDSVDMASAAITALKVDQAVRIKVDAAIYAKDYVLKATTAHTETLIEVQNFRAKSPTHATVFDSVHAELTAILEAK